MIQILALEHHVQYSVEVRSVYTDEFRFNVFGHKLEYWICGPSRVHSSSSLGHDHPSKVLWDSWSEHMYVPNTPEWFNRLVSLTTGQSCSLTISSFESDWIHTRSVPNTAENLYITPFQFVGTVSGCSDVLSSVRGVMTHRRDMNSSTTATPCISPILKMLMMIVPVWCWSFRHNRLCIRTLIFEWFSRSISERYEWCSCDLSHIIERWKRDIFALRSRISRSNITYTQTQQYTPGTP